jgi:hypothetical protein
MKSHGKYAAVMGSIGVILFLPAALFLPGCPDPISCSVDDQATEVVQYVVHGVDLDLPLDGGALDSWRWEIIEFENLVQTAGDLGAVAIDEAQVPPLPLDEPGLVYTLTGYQHVANEEIVLRYENAPAITPPENAYRLYRSTRTADETGVESSLSVWDYTVEHGGTGGGDATVERLLSYEIYGATLTRSRGLSPTTRMRVAAHGLWEAVESARGDLTGAHLLQASEVPLPGDGVARCSTCAYTKVVNYVVEDYWGDMFSPGCGDCGFYIKTESVVIDGVLVADIIYSWDYRY